MRYNYVQNDGWTTRKHRAYVCCPSRCGGWAWADRRLPCCAKCGTSYSYQWGGKKGAGGSQPQPPVPEGKEDAKKQQPTVPPEVALLLQALVTQLEATGGDNKAATDKLDKLKELFGGKDQKKEEEPASYKEAKEAAINSSKAVTKLEGKLHNLQEEAVKLQERLDKASKELEETKTELQVAYQVRIKAMDLATKLSQELPIKQESQPSQESDEDMGTQGPDELESADRLQKRLNDVQAKLAKRQKIDKEANDLAQAEIKKAADLAEKAKREAGKTEKRG